MPQRPSASSYSGIVTRPQRTLNPSNPEELATLKEKLQETFLQIRGFAGRARQDSNLRPSDS
jgi:hypothetical protein